MTLEKFLELMRPNQSIKIYWAEGEIEYELVYRIRWHHKELLDMLVTRVFSKEDTVCVYLNAQGEQYD